MKTQILNYRILIEKEQKNKKTSYVAFAPTLGISDFGKTVDQAVSNIEKAIKLYIDTLLDLKKPIPDPDAEDYFVTTRKIMIDNYAKSSFI